MDRMNFTNNEQQNNRQTPPPPPQGTRPSRVNENEELNAEVDPRNRRTTTGERAAMLGAGLAAGGASVFAATQIADAFNNDDEPADGVITDEEGTATDDWTDDYSHSPSQGGTHAGAHAAHTAATAHGAPNPASNPGGTTVPPETVVTNSEPFVPTPEDPDEIPQMAVTEIDPEDMDGEQIIHFADVGQIYYEDGSEETGAIAVTPEGNMAIMVDVDGDEVFDEIRDENNDVISYETAGYTVGDAQIEMAQQTGDYHYLPPEDHMTSDLPQGENFMDDIVDA